jgi:hypothetical protein
MQEGAIRLSYALSLLGCRTDMEGLLVLPALCSVLDPSLDLEAWSVEMAQRAVEIADTAPAVIDRWCELTTAV